MAQRSLANHFSASFRKPPLFGGELIVANAHRSGAEIAGLVPRRRLAFTFAVTVVLASSGHSISQTKGQADLSNARRAHVFKLQGLEGRIYDLADMRGNVVLISFGATWCIPCSSELHALEELKREYANRPVRFFWVSIENEEQISNDALKRFVRARQLSFPVLRDPAKLAFSQFSPRVRLPMIVFFGRDGRVDEPVRFGMRSPADLYKADVRARLNKLLADSSSGMETSR